MGFTDKIMRLYFDYMYNPVYDFTTARSSGYQALLDRCIYKLQLNANDKLLCVGLGTGNEIVHIMQLNTKLHIVGIDYSNTALEKAKRKASKLGGEIEVHLMDARHLEFEAETFSKVLCLHVMDFVEDNKRATGEIFRVLKRGGQYVVTYPSQMEGLRLGLKLIKEGGLLYNDNSHNHRIRALFELPVRIVLGTVYLPLLVRPNKRAYTRTKLEAMLIEFAPKEFQIEEFSVYQDFIVHGRK